MKQEWSVWAIATEPPTGSTQETIVCEVAQRKDGRCAIFIDVYDYRRDASRIHRAVLYRSGWRFKSSDSAKRRAQKLKQDYEASAY